METKRLSAPETQPPRIGVWHRLDFRVKPLLLQAALSSVAFALIAPGLAFDRSHAGWPLVGPAMLVLTAKCAFLYSVCVFMYAALSDEGSYWGNLLVKDEETGEYKRYADIVFKDSVGARISPTLQGDYARAVSLLVAPYPLWMSLLLHECHWFSGGRYVNALRGAAVFATIAFTVRVVTLVVGSLRRDD